MGLPVSTTRFADTGVSTGSAVSTGGPSERPAPSRFVIPRERIFHAAFASLSDSNPQTGHECSRTHSGLSVETPQATHSGADCGVVSVGNLLDSINVGDRPGSDREVRDKADPVPLTGVENILVVAILGLRSEQHQS